MITLQKISEGISAEAQKNSEERNQKKWLIEEFGDSKLHSELASQNSLFWNSITFSPPLQKKIITLLGTLSEFLGFEKNFRVL